MSFPRTYRVRQHFRTKEVVRVDRRLLELEIEGRRVHQVVRLEPQDLLPELQ